VGRRCAPEVRYEPLPDAACLFAHPCLDRVSPLSRRRTGRRGRRRCAVSRRGIPGCARRTAGRTSSGRRRRAPAAGSAPGVGVRPGPPGRPGFPRCRWPPWTAAGRPWAPRACRGRYARQRSGRVPALKRDLAHQHVAQRVDQQEPCDREPCRRRLAGEPEQRTYFAQPRDEDDLVDQMVVAAWRVGRHGAKVRVLLFGCWTGQQVPLVRRWRHPQDVPVRRDQVLDGLSLREVQCDFRVASRAASRPRRGRPGLWPRSLPPSSSWRPLRYGRRRSRLGYGALHAKPSCAQDTQSGPG
jgi:hypothetical protein